MTPDMLSFEDWCLMQEMRIISQLYPELCEDEAVIKPEEEFDPERYDVEVRQ